jgi:hypothetical protein
MRQTMACPAVNASRMDGFIIVSHLEVRIIRAAPVATPKEAKGLSMGPDLLVFGIDRFRGHRFLIDQIVYVSAPLGKHSDVPSNPKIVIATARTGRQWTAALMFFEKVSLLCKRAWCRREYAR